MFIPWASSNNLKLGLNVQPSVSRSAISHNLINRLNAQLKAGLGKQGDCLNSWSAHHERGGFGFSGKWSLTLGPAAWQKKYMDGLWSLKELDLNPSSIFISSGTLCKWLNLPAVRYKIILWEKGGSWHCCFPPQHLFYSFSLLKEHLFCCSRISSLQSLQVGT